MASERDECELIAMRLINTFRCAGDDYYLPDLQRDIAAALRDVARECAEIADEGRCGELTSAAIRERFGLTTTPNDKENSQ